MYVPVYVYIYALTWGGLLFCIFKLSLITCATSIMRVHQISQPMGTNKVTMSWIPHFPWLISHILCSRSPLRIIRSCHMCLTNSIIRATLTARSRARISTTTLPSSGSLRCQSWAAWKLVTVVTVGSCGEQCGRENLLFHCMACCAF